ncbi:MAG: nucleoside triphosphate pyrophosphohydrolase [Clostridia bacterium]|nr:nucleoside triphosphate pyrophosphohydrolase [Clostridia bacterium]
MNRIIHRKLVRDRIPEIIRRSGKQCRTRILTQEEYRRMLDLKLQEELGEYLESGSMEELADLVEVIRAAAEARGGSMDEVEAIRVRKAQERGGFRERILLVDTWEDG